MYSLVQVKCDRCKQTFLAEGYIHKVSMIKYDIDFKQESCKIKHKLCDKCYNELNEFLRNKKNA